MLITLMSLVRLYKQCPPNKILVISGKTGHGAAKCIHGGAAFVWPVIQSFSFLDLEPFVVQIDLPDAVSQDKVRVSIPAAVTVAISTEKGIMENAAVHLLSLGRQKIADLAEGIIVSQMRAVIATAGSDEIDRDRQAFTARVSEAAAAELAKIGMAVINIDIKDAVLKRAGDASTVEVDKADE